MPSLIHFLSLAALASAQGVIQSAQGTKGSPASLPLQVDLSAADANIINPAEIAQNVVNECGRTLLAGNIDIGTQTEGQLSNKTVTSVTKGGNVAVTINQLDGNGAGPYSCDMDFTSNADGTSGQTNLTVKETDTNGITTLSLTMPADMACVGASTGNICTVRCFNTAANGPFGGCFAVQQTDITPNANTPATIKTAQTLAGVNSQIASNQEDLAAAVKANTLATEGTDQQQGVFAVDQILGIDSTASATAGAAGVASTSAASAKSTAAAGKKGAAKGAAGAAAKGATGATAKGNGANANTNAATGATAKGKNNNNKRAPKVFIS